MVGLGRQFCDAESQRSRAQPFTHTAPLILLLQFTTHASKQTPHHPRPLPLLPTHQTRHLPAVHHKHQCDHHTAGDQQPPVCLLVCSHAHQVWVECCLVVVGDPVVLHTRVFARDTGHLHVTVWRSCVGGGVKDTYYYSRPSTLCPRLCRRHQREDST